MWESDSESTRSSQIEYKFDGNDDCVTSRLSDVREDSMDDLESLIEDLSTEATSKRRPKLNIDWMIRRNRFRHGISNDFNTI